MTAYQARFRPREQVRIASLSDLEAFQQTWTRHHPLTIAQLGFADRRAVVEEVGYYHGGDVLYTLQDIPGIWHEACLSGFSSHAV